MKPAPMAIGQTEQPRDPRMNAPVCISHLPPDKRRLALIARHRQSTIDFMATYQAPGKVGFRERLLRVLQYDPPVVRKTGRTGL